MPALTEFFLRLPGEAYVHDAVSPRFVQLSQGCARLHFSLHSSVSRSHVAHFVCLLSVSTGST